MREERERWKMIGEPTNSATILEEPLRESLWVCLSSLAAVVVDADADLSFVGFVGLGFNEVDVVIFPVDMMGCGSVAGQPRIFNSN